VNVGESVAAEVQGKISVVRRSNNIEINNQALSKISQRGRWNVTSKSVEVKRR
jgi:hypothetical protein